MEDKDFLSFGLEDENGMLTNAGALLADESPIRWSRVFCTRWNGLDKSGGIVDALDDAEYSGSLIGLLENGMAFIRRNMKTMWKKTSDSRIEMPEYMERSCLEVLVTYVVHTEQQSRYQCDDHHGHDALAVDVIVNVHAAHTRSRVGNESEGLESVHQAAEGMKLASLFHVGLYVIE